MAIQDRVAGWNSTAAEGDRLSLRLSLHAGELPRGRVSPQAVAVARAEATRQRTPPGAIWLTRPVALTMNQTEVPLEPVADSLPLPGGEQLALYRVQPSGGPLPYGGREAERVPRRSSVSRLLEPVTDTLGSLESGGERRWRASLRVAGALLTLLTLALAWLVTLAAAALVALSGRLWGLGREAPWAARARGGLASGRGWLWRRATICRTALARPLAARRRTAPPEPEVEVEVTVDPPQGAGGGS
jgi:hypothetical protein